MSIRDAFDRAAESYDALRRQLIPCFDDFYGTVLDALEELPDGRMRVLDLGAGTGLLSALILDRFPHASVTVFDISEGMLAVARRRFAALAPGRVAFVVGDYGTRTLGGPFDAVVSGLSIHHLEHEAKRALFGQVFAGLRPGGLFINADQVLGPCPEREARYRALWLDQVRAAGVGADQLAAARERMTLDRMAPLADQLRWLEAAGFVAVDALYKNWSFAVYAGVRPPRRA